MKVAGVHDVPKTPRSGNRQTAQLKATELQD